MSNPALEHLRENAYIVDELASPTLDEYFDKISGDWVKGNFSAIVDLCNEIIPDDIYDVRIVFYYLYSSWVLSEQEVHLDILEVTYSLVDGFLDDHEFNKGAEKKIVNNFYECLAVFCKKLAKRLERFPPAIDGDEEMISSICELLEKLQERLSKNEAFTSSFKSISSIIESYLPLLSEMESKSKGVQDYPNDEEVGERQVPSSTSASGTPSVDLVSGTSYYLTELLEKISLLKNLSESREEYKAAIVVEDIRYTLTNFNPLVYFPDLFRSYTEIIARNAGVYAGYIAEHEESQWQALQQCYMVDRESFKNLSIIPARITSQRLEHYEEESDDVYQ
ncbi:type VI secretion system protein IglI family protein [Microbulbifer sp. TRSA001]|uniref:type VI secretion system protein IglI family protein n=1 Tax=Microbulbifer sp. TRSA001 TaxID=3243381 RepID=UPI00403A2531